MLAFFNFHFLEDFVVVCGSWIIIRGWYYFLVRAGGGGERKYLMNSEIKLSLGLQISGGGGLGRGEENN